MERERESARLCVSIIRLCSSEGIMMKPETQGKKH